jgi:hypothetical protein
MTELELKLVAIGRQLDVPEAPDVTTPVRARLGAARPAPRRRRLVLAFAVLALAALFATLAIPDARSALLRFLQIGGDRIELVDELPAVAPSPPELDLILGERVTLDEARRRAAFDLLELEEEPDSVYIGDRGTVWFLYGTPQTVRLLVAQTPKLQIDESFLLKKLAGAGTIVETTTVGGAPAYFLSGAPHVVILVDENGFGVPESTRLARDVLVWEENGRTVRLEGDLTLAEATELAESLR